MTTQGEDGTRASPEIAADAGRPEQLFDLASDIVTATTDFQTVRGPGDGDRSTQSFIRQLGDRAHEVFGEDYSEKRICGETNYAVDFYFPDEATIVEVALGLPNPNTEFEKDMLKALIARDSGHEVRRLYFISRPGAKKKCSQPGRAALMQWAETKHDLVIEIHDLPGAPRKRTRLSRR